MQTTTNKHDPAGDSGPQQQQTFKRALQFHIVEATPQNGGTGMGRLALWLLVFFIVFYTVLSWLGLLN